MAKDVGKGGGEGVEGDNDDDGSPKNKKRSGTWIGETQDHFFHPFSTRSPRLSSSRCAR